MHTPPKLFSQLNAYFHLFEHVHQQQSRQNKRFHKRIVIFTSINELIEVPFASMCGG